MAVFRSFWICQILLLHLRGRLGSALSLHPTHFLPSAGPPRRYGYHRHHDAPGALGLPTPLAVAQARLFADPRQARHQDGPSPRQHHYRYDEPGALVPVTLATTSPPTDPRQVRRRHREGSFPHAEASIGAYQSPGVASDLLLSRNGGTTASFQKNLGLTCSHCGGPLGTEWTEYDNRKYHPECYHEFVQPKCDVCLQGLDGAWFISDQWGNRAHTHHGHEPTVSCSSCQRIIGKTTSKGGSLLEDGRVLCGICQSSSINKGSQIPKALGQVMNDLRQVMSVQGFQGRIDVHLADRMELTNRAQGAGCAHGNFHGLTTTTRITTDVVVMEHEITLLEGLPDLQFRGVMAHELLHVWLNEAGLQPPTEIMEGFCNLGSYAVYSTAAPQDRDFARVLLQQMEQDPDPVYGDGYRSIKSILQQQGWQGVFRKVMSYPRRRR